MDIVRAREILTRIDSVDQLLSVELKEVMDQAVMPLNEGLASAQESVNGIAEQVIQLGEDFRERLSVNITDALSQFEADYISPAQELLQVLTDTCETLTEAIEDLTDQVTQPVDDFIEWTEGLFEEVEEFKQTIVSEIETQADEFIEVVSDVSDDMYGFLEEQLAKLAQAVEDWVNKVTYLGDEKVQQALATHTKTLTDEITKTINDLLDELLSVFDKYLAQAKDTLLEAVSQSGATRKSIEPALEQLEVIREMIDAVVEEVRGLGNKVGIPV